MMTTGSVVRLICTTSRAAACLRLLQAHKLDGRLGARHGHCACEHHGRLASGSCGAPSRVPSKRGRDHFRPARHRRGSDGKRNGGAGQLPKALQQHAINGQKLFFILTNFNFSRRRGRHCECVCQPRGKGASIAVASCVALLSGIGPNCVLLPPWQLLTVAVPLGLCTLFPQNCGSFRPPGS